MIRAWLAPCLITLAVRAGAAGTTIPVSVELANGIADSLFPVTLRLERGTYYLTEPRIEYLDQGRVGLQARLQAYIHRPEENVAISETGGVAITGQLGYDPIALQILFHHPTLEQLEFDQDNPEARQFNREVQKAWRQQLNDPMRADLPPHPYIQMLKYNIGDIGYDGSHINLELVY